MEDFDDLDALVERRSDNEDDFGGGDDDGNRNAERQDEAIEVTDEKRIVPVKIRVLRPQPKLDATRLKGPRGLSVLPTWFDGIQLKGKHHEVEDLNAVINRLEQWTHRLFPRYTFDDAIDKLEKLGKKNEVKVILKRIRLDLDNNDFVEQLEDDVVAEEAPPTSDDIFDRIASTARSNTIDIFPITSTPGVNKTVLTEEQRQRMMQNRMLAEERRQAKIKARREQELNANTTTADTS